MKEIVVEKIEIDGKTKNLYLCDQKKECNKSDYCGKECTKTFDKDHALLGK